MKAFTMVAAIVLGVTVATTAVPSLSTPGRRGTQFAGAAQDRNIDLRAERSQRQLIDEARSAQAPSERRYRSVQTFGCTLFWEGSRIVPDVDGLCDDGTPLVYASTCEGWEPPWWRTVLEPGAAAWSPWERLDLGSCPADRLPAMTAEDFRRLALPAPVLRTQPAGDWVLVNIETVVMTDATPVVLTTDLLGVPVEVEARPTLFTYDFGDGSEPLVTRDAGRPWPDVTTYHVYERPGTAAITLTTTWSGRYRAIGASEWSDVAGTATTTTTGAPFRVEERTSRLVSGLCTDRPAPPDC